MGETKATEQCDSNPQIHSMKYWLANRDSQFMDDDDDDDDDDPHYIWPLLIFIESVFYILGSRSILLWIRA